MRAQLTQAGTSMLIDCAVPALDRLLSEACGPALRLAGEKAAEAEPLEPDPDIHLVLNSRSDPFLTAGWQPLTRGAFHQNGNVVMHNACGSGFDLRITVMPDAASARITLEARYRPPRRERLAGYLLRSRFHLLARAVLLQYPAMWVASTRGRVPLHAGAVRFADGVALLVGPGGVGRSTVLLDLLRRGGVACSDNLCVSDGKVVHGLVEPVRIEGVGGRRMPYGRGETALPRRVDSLVPDRIIVLRRVVDGPCRVTAASSSAAVRAMVGGTYMAGELSRYWAFAATLSYGTGRGPAHPPIVTTAQALARLPCSEITLGAPPPPALEELINSHELVSA